MNSLTVAAHAEALGGVLGRDDATPAADCLLDAGDTDADRFAERVLERLDGEGSTADHPTTSGPRVDARHQADEDDPLVGAASIVAKVARDAHVEDLAAAVDARFGDLGSGYPSDPTTREFLRSYVDATGELPDCARESWQTCADLLAAAEQSALADF
jgi:ribonuclease HII